jgi:threonine/homoserine/homoserine lactone efflux protein
MIVVSYALAGGKRSGLATVPGVALGDLTAMTVSLLCAGAILSASATLFMILKLCGAAYLFWLGIQLWRAKPQPLEMEEAEGQHSWSRMFFSSYVVTALNPKGIVFFIAFVPQFFDVSRAIAPQMVILIATFVGLAAVNVAAWAFFVGTMRERFSSPAVLGRMAKAGGALLMVLSVVTALTRRSAA